jgi:hypothetical protein
MPGLFMYRHRVHNNWVVCCWLGDDAETANGWFVELLLLCKPDALTRDQVHELRIWASNQALTMRDVKRKLWEDERARIRKEQDNEQEARDAQKWLAKRFRKEGDPAYATPTFKTSMRAVRKAS